SRYLGEQTVPAGPFPQPPPPVDVRMTCPSCGKHLRIPPELQGRKLKCPRCQTRLTTPVDPRRPPTTTAEAGSAGTTTAPAAPPPPSVPTARARQGDTVGEPPRSAPPPPVAPVVPMPPRRGSPVLLAVGIGVMLTILVWGLILLLNR